MKIVTASHSHIAIRQQWFFKEVANQGHDVMMISPGVWGDLKATPYGEDMLGFGKGGGTFRFITCRHQGSNLYNYKLLGAKDLVDYYDPDWLYIQAEPGSLLAEEAIGWKAKKRALFTWENIALNPSPALPRYDLVVCGNPKAEGLVKNINPRTYLALQVGINTDHFAARPDVERNITVGYIGRMASEKGLPYLGQAWPTVNVMGWVDYLMLPWQYSQVQVLVAFSQDVPFWKEQAPNYVVLEALSNGCKCVVSDTAAMKFWLEGCPNTVQVQGHEQPTNLIHLDRVVRLQKGIQAALDMEASPGGRQWVVDRFSNKVVAKKLLEAMNV